MYLKISFLFTFMKKIRDVDLKMCEFSQILLGGIWTKSLKTTVHGACLSGEHHSSVPAKDLLFESQGWEASLGPGTR